MSASIKEIYDLFNELCKQLAGPKHREVYGCVLNYLTRTPTAIDYFNTVIDDTVICSKISNYLALNSSARNDAIIFKNSSEQLKAHLTDNRIRNGMLSFLFTLTTQHVSTYACSLEAATNRILPLKGPIIPPLEFSDIDDAAYLSARDDTLTKGRLSTTSMKMASVGAHVSISNPSIPTVQRRDISSQQTQHEKSDSSVPNISIPKMSADQRRSISSQPTQTERNESAAPSAARMLAYDLKDDLVSNIIYSFTGTPGKYLRKDVITGSFKLSSKAKSLNIAQAGMLLRLSELGYYHDQIKSFTDVKSGRCALGFMGQGFMCALQIELTNYYGLVATLQEELSSQRRPAADSGNVGPGTLVNLLAWAADPLHRFQWLSKIAEACQEKKGGALASTIYDYFSNGDPVVMNLVRELLIAVCQPLQQMLSRWVLEGEILDTNAEFFIECLAEVGPDRLWHEKYRVRNSMLPTFITTEIANKILVIGKSINFLREICQDKTPIKGREELKLCLESNADNIFSNLGDTNLHIMIDAVYLSTSKKVLDIVMGPHKFLQHLQAMRRYLLLGQGDFIGILMENLKSELDKPGKDLYCYDLSSIMDAAIRSTNAQYDDPEILNNLDVRLQLPCEGDTGWDILSLHYTVHGPLATMFDPCMHNYQILFKPLWRMKHIEFLLSSKIWRDQTCNAKQLRSMSKELNPIMYRLHLHTSKMTHFIHQMKYYVLFEVIECSWSKFLDKIRQAKALDDILQAHNEFLETVTVGAFLDAKSDSLSGHMEEAYGGIVRLEFWQDNFFDICFKELNSRQQFDTKVLESEAKAEYGVTAESRLQRDGELKAFGQSLKICEKNLEKIGNEYEMAVRQFLYLLNSNNDHNLQLFGIRLDFNEYYKKRDQRLGVPLTFEHMRMSSGFFNSKSNAMNCSKYSTN